MNTDHKNIYKLFVLSIAIKLAIPLLAWILCHFEWIETNYCNFTFLNVYSNSDSGWYHNIANGWYDDISLDVRSSWSNPNLHLYFPYIQP
ncbi:MAG: hypothetical protein R2852_08610 [Bacteroidia bacterium]